MLPILTNKQINSILKSTELEDTSFIKEVERLLNEKRGYIFKMPKPGTPVISLMSGGIDTTVVTAILMEEFGLQVWPVYFDRKIGNSKKTRESLNFYSDFFKKSYSRLFCEPKVLSIRIPPEEISQAIFLEDIKEKKIKNDSEQRRGIPFQPSLYAYFSTLYSFYLEDTLGLKIRNIFGGWVPLNSDWYVYETLSAFRQIMLELCLMTKDFSWQFTSLPMEKEIGFFFDKEYLMRWAHLHQIPLERTWTCNHSKRFQCGNCTPCSVRRSKFKEARVKDKTIYLSDRITIIKKLKNKIKYFLIALQSHGE